MGREKRKHGGSIAEEKGETRSWKMEKALTLKASNYEMQVHARTACVIVQLNYPNFEVCSGVFY